MNLATLDIKRRTDPVGLIKFHLINKLVFEKNEDIINSDILILAHLSLKRKVELRSFCYDLARKLYPGINPEDYAIKEQNIRNRVNKLEKKGFIVKNNKHNKVIQLVPELQMDVDVNTLYKYSLLCIYEPIVKR